MTINPTTWAQAIREMSAAGTLRQGVWNAEDEGRHIACILGASSPDVNDVEDVNCAALCMPQWLAELTQALFDGIAPEQANAYALRYADVAERWCVLTPEAWGRVSVTFRVACIEQALAAAEAAQPAPFPAYWEAGKTACREMVAALKSGDTARVDKADAAEEAWAAVGAAAWAAAWAARAAVGAAAEAVLAARAAVGAAVWAARAAVGAAAEAAAWAAWAAYARLFDALLDAINAELAADMKETTP
jgi:hypothetical protein